MELYKVIRNDPLCLLSTNKYLDMNQPRTIIPPDTIKKLTQ